MAGFSQIFKDMDEVRAYAESLKKSMSKSDFEFMLYLFGLMENRGESEPVQLCGRQIEIDRSIAPIIADLNESGIVTLASCSGLQCEHPYGRFRPKAGYLALEWDDALMGHLKTALDGSRTSVAEGECYLKPAICIKIHSTDDSVLREEWTHIWETLKAWRIEENGCPR